MTRTRRSFAVLAAAAVALGAASACTTAGATTDASGAASNTVDGSNAVKDVTLGACKRGDAGAVDATATVKNPTGARATYAITVEALDAKGVRVAEANGTASAVAAGGTATVTLVGMLDNPAAAVASCKIAQVSRI